MGIDKDVSSRNQHQNLFVADRKLLPKVPNRLPLRPLNKMGLHLCNEIRHAAVHRVASDQRSSLRQLRMLNLPLMDNKESQRVVRELTCNFIETLDLALDPFGPLNLYHPAFTGSKGQQKVRGVSTT